MGRVSGTKVLDFSMLLERCTIFRALILGQFFISNSASTVWFHGICRKGYTQFWGQSVARRRTSIDWGTVLFSLFKMYFNLFHLSFIWYLDVPKLMAKLWKQDEPISVRPLICFLHVVPSNFHWVCYPNQRYIVGIFLLDGELTA